MKKKKPERACRKATRRSSFPGAIQRARGPFTDDGLWLYHAAYIFGVKAGMKQMAAELKKRIEAL